MGTHGTRSFQQSTDSTAKLGFEATRSVGIDFDCDKVRNHLDATEPRGARQINKGKPKAERGTATQIPLRTP